MGTTRCRVCHFRLRLRSLCSFYVRFSQLSFIFSVSQATFFRFVSVSSFCSLLLCFDDILGVCLWACVHLVASSSLMLWSAFVWLTLFPRLFKLARTSYQIQVAEMTKVTRCPPGVFRLVFYHVSSVS